MLDHDVEKDHTSSHTLDQLEELKEKLAKVTEDLKREREKNGTRN